MYPNIIDIVEKVLIRYTTIISRPIDTPREYFLCYKIFYGAYITFVLFYICRLLTMKKLFFFRIFS